MASCVIGICAIATARFRIACMSEEYLLTPLNVRGVRTEVAGVTAVVDINLPQLLIGSTAEINTQIFPSAPDGIMGALTKLSIVIPAYNEEQRLTPTLDRIFSYLDHLPDQSAEVIVVDDGSRDSTAALVETRAQIRAAPQAGSQSRQPGKGIFGTAWNGGGPRRMAPHVRRGFVCAH